MKAAKGARFKAFPAVMACLAVIAGIGVAGYLYEAAERRSFTTAARHELAAVADMKVRQVVAWRAERLGEAKVLQLNSFTARALRENLDNGRGRSEIETRMELWTKATHYTAISLWDRNSRRRLWVPAAETADAGQREFIMQAMRGKEPVLGDLQRDVPTGAVHICMAVPLVSAASPEPFGALLLTIGPEQILSPLVQSWPAPSTSAETLLVRREGEDVVFLNEFRHRKDTALNLRLPVTEERLPAARVLLGYEETLEGVDYRGVPVLAVTRGVPGSPWFVVAKVDSEEVFAPVRQRTRFIAGFFGLAGLSLIAGIMFLWSRLAARATRTSEVRYRRLFEAAKDGILILDAETGMIVDVNPFLTDLLGFPREAFLNKRLWDLGFFKDAVANRENFWELQQQGYIRYEDLPLKTADGRQKAVEFVSNTYLEDNQKVIQCDIRDITERKQAEAALRASEGRYRELFENSQFGIYRSTPGGRLVLVNPKLLTMLGFTSMEEFAQRNLESGGFEPGYDRAWFKEVLGRDGVIRNHEAKWTCRDGSILHVVENAVAVRDSEGAVLYYDGTVEDFTARKLMEEALRESEERFRQVAESAGEWIWEVDASGLFTYASPVAESILGHTPEELVGTRYFYDLFHPEDREARKTAALAAFAAKQPFKGFVNRNLRRDGQTVWLSTNGMPLLDSGGNLLGYRGADTDITERKRAEEEREQLQLQLAQAQKIESIGRLAGGVAHDFNNLLTVINGRSELLLGNLREGDPLRADIQEIHKAGERAAGLTAQLLAFSRKQVLQPRTLDLNQLVDGMRSMLERLVGEDVEVSVALSAEAVFVRADPHQLEQALMNLVVNARDAMPHGGKLLIETACVEWDESYAQSHAEARVGRYIMLAVSDNGTGMDEETRRRVFEPFYTTKGVGQGTGLGLSTVQGIVTQSGGSIEVYSEPGHGTTFKIYLPRVEQEAADGGRAEAVPTLRGTETVLVVEDQEAVRDYAAAALGSYGYRVLKAEDAGAALAACEREHVALVITDVVMPGMSGQELADQLAARATPG